MMPTPGNDIRGGNKVVTVGSRKSCHAIHLDLSIILLRDFLSQLLPFPLDLSSASTACFSNSAGLPISQGPTRVSTQGERTHDFQTSLVACINS